MAGVCPPGTPDPVMYGSVSAEGREAVLAIRVFDPGGDEQTADVGAVIDTGFTGHLTLPPDMAVSLALPESWSEELVLADGSREIATVHRATVIWHGRRRSVPVHSVPGDILLGMAMLSGSRLQPDAAPNGEVIVEEMSQAGV